METINILQTDEIEKGAWEYSDELKAELEGRYEYYKNGGAMISAGEADNEINKIFSQENK